VLEGLQKFVVDACGKGLFLPHARKLIINFNIIQVFFIYFYKFLFFSFFKSAVGNPGAEAEGGGKESMCGVFATTQARQTVG
jgi:hypothetical protein